MKILLLSAYHAQSHQSWCSSLMAMFPELEWTLLSLPGRYFNWRVRGNALSWSVDELETLNKKYDLVIATSMVDCATLRGLVPNLAVIPWRIYFHENQFEYPVDAKYERIEPKMVSLYNALCAERIIFNSQYNLKTFIAGLSAFLKKMPDEVPDTTISRIEAKCHILPVPINIPNAMVQKNKNSVPVLLWNHRWEYDKGPERMLNLINELVQRKFEFKLNLIGQQFRNIPSELKQLKEILPTQLLHYGYIESTTEYNSILEMSDMVLSTAVHDFQGLAVLEAVAVGCIPIVPHRLAYTEFFPSSYCYQSCLDKPTEEAIAMADKILELWGKREQIDLNKINIQRLSHLELKQHYQKTLLSH